MRRLWPISGETAWRIGWKAFREICERCLKHCPRAAALLKSAAWALKFGGDCYLVHRPERLGELIAAGAAVGLEAKRLGLVRHRPGDPVSFILLGFRKGGKPGLNWEEWILHAPDGSPTELYNAIYHQGG